MPVVGFSFFVSLAGLAAVTYALHVQARREAPVWLSKWKQSLAVRPDSRHLGRDWGFVASSPGANAKLLVLTYFLGLDPTLSIGPSGEKVTLLLPAGLSTSARRKMVDTVDFQPLEGSSSVLLPKGYFQNGLSEEDEITKLVLHVEVFVFLIGLAALLLAPPLLISLYLAPFFIYERAIQDAVAKGLTQAGFLFPGRLVVVTNPVPLSRWLDELSLELVSEQGDRVYTLVIPPATLFQGAKGKGLPILSLMPPITAAYVRSFSLRPRGPRRELAVFVPEKDSV